VGGLNRARNPVLASIKGVVTTADKSDSPQARSEPRASAVSFITTEHFTLQGARAATITESTARASMFLLSVSGGLVALGLVATATSTGDAFFAFALVLLPTLAFVGLVTFDRTLQSGTEDLGYARRIARLRAYYFDNAPELAPYVLSVPPAQRLLVEGLRGGYVQGFRTVAGMVAMITGILTGAAVALAIAAGVDAPVAAFTSGGLTALAVLTALMRHQRSVWKRAHEAPIVEDDTVTT
jgi:hypothetical protein